MDRVVASRGGRTGSGAGSIHHHPGSALRADAHTLTHAHINALAGAALALGLKFAGSASTQAHAVLRGCVRQLMDAKRRAADACPAPPTGPLGAATAPAPPPVDSAGAAAAVAAVHRVDKAHLECALDVVVVALAMVMAGTGEQGGGIRGMVSRTASVC